MLWLGEVDPTQKSWTATRRKRAIGQQNRDGPRATGQGCQRLGENLHGRVIEHLLDHDLVDLPGAFTGDHQPGTNLSEFNTVGNIQHTIEDTETGIRGIVDSHISLHTDR